VTRDGDGHPQRQRRHLAARLLNRKVQTCLSLHLRLISKMSTESPSSHRRTKDRYRSPEEARQRRRRKSTVRETDRLQSSHAGISHRRMEDQDEALSDSEEDAATQSGSVDGKPTGRHTRVVYAHEKSTRPHRSKERRRAENRESRGDVRRTEESARRSRAHRSRRATITEMYSTSTTKRYCPLLHGLLHKPI
jgi:hypothetical protein